MIVSQVSPSKAKSVGLFLFVLFMCLLTTQIVFGQDTKLVAVHNPNVSSISAVAVSYYGEQLVVPASKKMSIENTVMNITTIMAEDLSLDQTQTQEVYKINLYTAEHTQQYMPLRAKHADTFNAKMKALNTYRTSALKKTLNPEQFEKCMSKK